MKRRKRGFMRTLAVTLAVFAVIFFGAVILLEHIADVSDDAQTAMVRDAVRSAVATCYAVEGMYPGDLNYLKENYGLAYNEERFFVAYDAFASNVYPDIIVNMVGGK